MSLLNSILTRVFFVFSITPSDSRLFATLFQTQLLAFVLYCGAATFAVFVTCPIFVKLSIYVRPKFLLLFPETRPTLVFAPLPRS